jgi:NAD(P)-dependent dehydrogenase (short-subunit alcohol dehydrogenase family)
METPQKTLLLTGASRGIGHATVSFFSEKNWKIITCSRESPPDECLRDLNWSHHITADLTDPNSIDSFIEETNNFLGDEPLHGIVNNAGWSPKSPLEERLGCLNGDLDAWRTVFELNFFAPLRLARGFASALTKGKGSIVNITSIAGHAIHPFAGSAYGTSKAALTSLTRELANEFAELGVRVNSVAPGEIETAMLSAQTEVLIPRIPLHRLGKPKDVASTIYFLCSDDSEYITGTEIFVTGGQHML